MSSFPSALINRFHCIYACILTVAFAHKLIMESLMVIINGMLVHYRIVCSQLPAAIVKKLCLVAQVEYDVRHSGLVHDMSKVRILYTVLVD